MSEKPKVVESMISKVMKKKNLTHTQAIDYMLGVATGRLAALWRYDDSLPDGKQSKGILTVAGRKKRAEKTARISILPDAKETAEKPAKSAKSKPAKSKPAKSKPAKSKPAKSKPAKSKPAKSEAGDSDQQLEIATQ